MRAFFSEPRSSLKFLFFFIGHLLLSGFFLMIYIGNGFSFPEVGPPPPPSALLDIAHSILTFPLFPLVFALPEAWGPFIPIWLVLPLNSALWAWTICALLETVTRRRGLV